MPNMESYVRNVVEELRITLLSDLEKRSKPLSVDSAASQSMTQLIEEHFLKWPPRDRRVTPWMAGEGLYDFEFSDRAWFTYATMDLRILNRLPRKNTIEIGIFLLSNKKDFVAYNRMVENHNDLAESKSRGSGIDPKTGERITAETVSEYWPIINSDGLEETAFHELEEVPGHKKPKPEYSLVATIALHLEIQGNNWVLKGQVQDSERKLLFQDTITNCDLSEATCQMVHRIFGNPNIETSGNPYYGLNMLLSGDKIDPGTVNAAKKKEIGSDYHINKALERLFRYVLPTVLIPSGLLIYVLGFNKLHDNHLGLGFLVAIVLPAISVGISRYFYRKRIEILKSYLDE